MIREANKSDCINLAALSMEVWLTTYSIDGIRTENSQYALSTFTKKHFRGFIIFISEKIDTIVEQASHTFPKNTTITKLMNKSKDIKALSIIAEYHHRHQPFFSNPWICSNKNRSI